MCAVLFVCINNENLNEILNKEDRMKQFVFVCLYVYVCVCERWLCACPERVGGTQIQLQLNGSQIRKRK